MNMVILNSTSIPLNMPEFSIILFERINAHAYVTS